MRKHNILHNELFSFSKIIPRSSSWDTFRSNMAFKCRLVDLQKKNRVFKCRFVAIFNVRLKFVWCYDSENARYWWIHNKVQFEDILNAKDRARFPNNVQQRPIWMHTERKGTHRNGRKHIGSLEITQRRHIMSNKCHVECPIHARTITHLPSCVFFAVVLFFCAVAAEIIWIKTVLLNFLTHS